jgi:hypothetical protein
MTTETETNWFADHANVVMLTAYMADSDQPWPGREGRQRLLPR